MPPEAVESITTIAASGRPAPPAGRSARQLIQWRDRPPCNPSSRLGSVATTEPPGSVAGETVTASFARCSSAAASPLLSDAAGAGAAFA